jgi:hypothetical protein
MAEDRCSPTQDPIPRARSSRVDVHVGSGGLQPRPHAKSGSCLTRVWPPFRRAAPGGGRWFDDFPCRNATKTYAQSLFSSLLDYFAVQNSSTRRPDYER